MKTLTILLALGILFNPAFAQNDAQLSAQFDQLLSAQFKPNEPGATALVAKKGRVIYKKGFGMANLELDVPMKTDHVFRIGSITKQFTAIAILQLMEQGKLNLQDEITKFIPDYPTQGNKITVEHLLTHTSGIRDFASMRDTVQRGRIDFTPRQMIDYFRNEPMRFAPGTKYEYSNSGYVVLGYIIEKITGRTYAQYLEENFFKPLGMNSSLFSSDTKLVKNRASGYSKTKQGFENAAPISMTQPYAAGAILSTVEDLCKWQKAVQSYQLVKKETLDKAWTRYQLNDGSPINYGYGWRQGFIQGSASLWHGGLINGFITMAMYLPGEDVFVAVFSNCENNSPVDVTAKLAALAIGKPYEYKAIAVDSPALRKYEGVYENGKGQQRIITVSGDRLFVQLNRSPKSQIKAYQKDGFFFEADPMVSVDFIRNNKGEVEKLVTKSRTAIESWSKTDKAIPSDDGIRLDEKILESFAGVYEVNPEFRLVVTRENSRLFVEPARQEKFEIFAESETKFFLKINDAQMEFVKDGSGKVIKVTIMQGGRKTDALRIK